ncbi:3-phosphoshikimate 1-carboxyvinyltransferase [Thalassospira tepidiphila]|uniref:3-phosphoshikimate 1-carboxyvinyltransferase n=2 Tax=Thalassospira tepidiphila TaxID=393657 RepID=A0A853L2T5_9PROT|nr:3-phosphoshikimate 1-carboxyvinyltransferase [Thalassospira tepidiphila]NJB73107.1 3-phosphoshikimate 1-carboxyvinyltransferase [Thalassospira tepidiphila]OAZ11169.1 3-phosphoshikimate 1-carboxyvinyltransferase [Thalassospira tepidiphila MCCC 1A03514]
MSSSQTKRPLSSAKAGPLSGDIRVPGDKSISHRSLMFGGLAIGTTKVTGLLEGEDVLATADAMRKLGATVTRDEDGTWHVTGVGVGALREPDSVIDMGNAGTGIRLMAGIVATHPITTFFTGDASLCKRPMGRVADPLSEFGAQFITRDRGRPPMAVIGTDEAKPVTYTLPMASAQVKSAVMLAGLNTTGTTTVIEPKPSRDHTERMLRHFGVEVDVKVNDDGGRTVSLTGPVEMKAADIVVPTDPSSAAFPMVAALINPDSHVTIRDVCLNLLRTGLITTLIEMGGDITITNEREEAGETIGDLVVTGKNRLKGIVVPAERAPSMIDEYPVLAVAAAYAEGETRMCDLEELRVKESDRLAAVAAGLEANGVIHRIEGDDLIVTGGVVPGGGMVETHLDHRIAMSFLVLGLGAEKPVAVDDANPIATSFPNFEKLMGDMGAKFALHS